MTETTNRSHSLDRDDQLDAVDLRQTGPRLKRVIWSTVFAILAAVLVGWLCWIVMSPGNERYIPSSKAGAWRTMGFFAGGAALLTFGATNWWRKRAHARANPPVPTAAMRK